MPILRHRHACLLALAFLASALLPLLPATGRLHLSWLALRAADGVELQALCSTDGLRYVAVPQVGRALDGTLDETLGKAPDEAPDEAPHEAPGETGHGHDCAYCPLLSATILSVIPALATAPAIGSMPPHAGWTDAAPPAFRDGARGARAPPPQRIA